MFKLIVVTLAAFFVVLQVFGEQSRRPVVTREAPAALTLASMVGMNDRIDEVSLEPEPLLTESDAIALAIEAGAKARLEQKSSYQTVALRGVPKAIDPEQGVENAEPVAKTPIVTWVVSGNRVNLRQGPGTSNAVVTQVTLGTEAEVIGSKNGWMQIVTVDGDTTGWISGKYLKEQTPS